MLIAELKGKIPSKLTNSEDMLTSSIFGSLKYLSSPSYIQSILQSSVNNEGAKICFNNDLIACYYEFWPSLNNCEPDLLLHLRDSKDAEYIICIEAKYWSGKSSEEDTSIEIDDRKNGQRDQLAREIEDIHTDFCTNLLNANNKKITKRLLIYLTNDTIFPFESINTSAKHIQNIHYPVTEIFWLTWSEIYSTIKEITKYKTLQDSILLTDIKQLMEKKGLKSFDGFTHSLKYVPPFILTYDMLTDGAIWTNFASVEPLHWKYGGINNGYE